MLVVYLLLLFYLGISNGLDTITPMQPLRDSGDTLLSPGGRFEMGFFSPGNPSKRYLGIWYQRICPRTIVWVANRETSLADASGILNITNQGALLLTDGMGGAIWSSNSSRRAKSPVLKLLESGNLVIKESDDMTPEKFLWESFDHPCDTFLPGMKLGTNFVTNTVRYLSSWKSREDPSPGKVSLIIDTRGFPQLVLKQGDGIVYRVGSWNGIGFTGTPNLEENPICTYHFEFNKNEVYYTCDAKGSSVSRLMVNETGVLQRYFQILSGGWMQIYSKPDHQCENYALCGTNAFCSINSNPVCACLKGFVPKSSDEWKKSNWSQGCARKDKLNCERGNQDRDRFQNYTRLKLPDTSGSRYNTTISLDECKRLCSDNCSCMAYANTNVSGSGCLHWFGDLIDIVEFSEGGQDLYIRMANLKSDHLKASTKAGIIAGSAFAMAIVAILIGLIFNIRRKNLKKEDMAKSDHGDMELLVYDFNTVDKATDNFSISNKLGEGGFGPVYKGTLIDGQEIAVKRLSKSSGQGIEEFKTEVTLIAKLQHRNLVKLLGCCIQANENMLIYEYMPNKSLDYFIFGDMRSQWLDWQMCIRIIGGIARGILYLHQDSRMRIIHRDLKASNVLLDNDMNPKISDFGMARIFGGDEAEVNTNKVVGTYGYMAPEYAVDGIFSVKSDVFSFGVLVLEIISGKKNRGFFHADHNRNLLGHAWILWKEERPLELIVDELDISCSMPEILRCIHVGLLCVQQRPEDRPNMASVVLMLGSEDKLPEPKQPGFFTERNLPFVENSLTTNEMTLTILEAR